jgi:hypothetical protein
MKKKDFPYLPKAQVGKEHDGLTVAERALLLADDLFESTTTSNLVKSKSVKSESNSKTFTKKDSVKETRKPILIDVVNSIYSESSPLGNTQYIPVGDPRYDKARRKRPPGDFITYWNEDSQTWLNTYNPENYKNVSVIGVPSDRIGDQGEWIRRDQLKEKVSYAGRGYRNNPDYEIGGSTEPTKEFYDFYEKVKKKYPNASEEQILNVWEKSYLKGESYKNPFLAVTPLIPGSQSTFEQYGISEPYINNASYFNETPYPQKVRDIDYNDPLVYPTVVDNEEIPTRFTNPFLPESTKKLPGYLSQLDRMPTRSVTQIGSPSSLVYDPKKAKSVSKAINKLAKEDAEYRRNQREADEVILPTEESTSWRVNEEAPTSNADMYASEISKDWETVVPEFRVKTKPKVDTSPVVVDITSNPNYDWGYAMNNKGNIEYKTESPNFIERNAPVYKKGGYLPKALFGNMFKKNKQPYGPTAFTDQFSQWQDNSQTAKNAQRQPQANPMFMSGQNAPMTSNVDNIQGTGTELILNLNKPSNTNTKVEEDPLSWYEQDEAFDPLKVNFDKNTKSEPSFGQKVGAFAKGMWKGANADNILLGTKALNNLLEKTPDYDQFQRNYKEPGQSMSRGDWTTNQGFLQPNRLGYFDKFSVGTGSMQFGGEVDMTDDEIYEFLAAGGELEFID